MAKINDTAPNFDAVTTEGEINFHNYIDGSWAILFSHPKNFTPVCTTELGYLASIKNKFDERNVKIIGLSVDTIDNHSLWSDDIEATQGFRPNYPVIADSDRTIAKLYDMIHENANDTLTVRTVYVIGPDKKIKLKIDYPASTGRNFDEILRVVDSLQLTANHSVATPVNWTKGDDVIIVPSVTDEQAKEKFTNGWQTLRPYLRVVKDPTLQVS